MKTPATMPAPRPKNRLLAQMRRLHLWFGVIAALFLLIFGLTGIVLNYKKPLFAALGLEPAPEAQAVVRPADRPAKTDHAPSGGGSSSRFTTTTGLTAAGVTPDTALALARRELGEVPLERIELKQERDGLVWKIKSRAGHEVLINASTGAAFSKGPYEKLGPPGADGRPARSFDWGKFLLDLHTGKIGGEVGKAVMTVAAGGLLFLTFSGLYLWLKPLLIRRTNARARVDSPSVPILPAQPAPVPTRCSAGEPAPVLRPAPMAAGRVPSEV